MTAEEETVFTGVGQQAVLVCTVHSSPEAEINWYRGNMRLEPDNRVYREDVGRRRTLVIHHVREEEFTGYRYCMNKIKKCFSIPYFWDYSVGVTIRMQFVINT